jgi:hypothetical protein
VLNGGRGELRRMLRRLRGCVYGNLVLPVGIVVRLLGFCGACAGVLDPGGTAVIGVVPSKVKTWAPFCSGGWADSGGVAVIALGKHICLTTAGDNGCAVTGVSR